MGAISCHHWLPELELQYEAEFFEEFREIVVVDMLDTSGNVLV